MTPATYSAIRKEVAQDPRAALRDCELLLARNSDDAEAHRLAARALRALGHDERASFEELAAIDAATLDPVLIQAGHAMVQNRLEQAEPLLRGRLRENPFDVAAIRMLAEVAGRIGRYQDAEKLLRRALELAPAFVAARTNLAMALYRQNKTVEALAELDRLTDEGPGNGVLRAAVVGRLGEFAEAISLYESVLARPGSERQPRIWTSYGHALKTVGRQADAVTAYRRALNLRPAFGEAWWSIANLKTVRLEEADIAAIQTGLAEPSANAEDRYHLHFALAKALEDAGRPEQGFDHYLTANALRRKQLPYSAERTRSAVDRTIALFDAPFLAQRKGMGCPAPDPVFVLGLPRAGSTLIEQILSCHSMVEGTMELPDILSLVSQLGKEGSYPEVISDLGPERLHDLGESYLERTRIHRREGKLLFIDKTPNNWLHAGLIHLILPNARIVDARRHPLDCGYSNFRQHFATGQAFSYDLADIGHYYADYVRLMRHFDTVLPGRTVRVIHEDLLDDPEAATRSLLDALNLPFEDACLRFFENDRAVRTASSEQVRRPINRDGAGLWRAVEDRLAPLREALGTTLDDYACR
ncbi:sulfotransferase [Novosphingobium sp. PP1Y]|uniref:tetratricopeptide repeat-containing sulfotransferase family protein n=1 Tax=Novosphingobium sp. PP1Y TaxID=702113 RepID=UPI00020EF85B|nr:sulfotransferase [Novosphingobium sp. PP1Y]CCA90659.1 FOG: TPR repeat domain protein [Novosphingobium sp. PP1Y]